MRVIFGTFGLCLAVVVCGAWAESPTLQSGLTFYSARGIDTNLPDFPARLLKNTLDYDNTWFEALGYTIGSSTPAFIDYSFHLVGLEGVSTGLDLIAVRHRGIQNHFESTVAYRLNTPYLGLGPIEARLGYSLGLSYAFETPLYERAPDGTQDRLMTYMAYELETKLRRYDRLGIVARIHHRSGAYGLFAPRGSGSNFLALGLRVHW